MDNDAVTNQSDFGISDNLAFLNVSTGNDTNIRNLEGLSYLHLTQNFFLELRVKHTLHSVFNIVDDVVDYPVKSDLDVFSVSKGLNCGGRSYVEADDDGSCCSGQHNIRFCYSTYACVDNLYSYVFVVELFKG